MITNNAPIQCLICYDDLNPDNYLEYQIDGDNTNWYPSFFCKCCTSVLQESQFGKWCNDLANSTCAREQRALLENGPPINLRDMNGFPIAGNNEIVRLRQASNQEEFSAKLVGAVEGEERIRLWDEYRRFIIKNEEIEDDRK